VLPEALNVRLRASLEYRVRTTMQRENIPHEEALRQVQRVDRDRAIFTRSVFGHEVDDPNVYDMVLQVDTLGVDACVTAILAAAQVRFGSLT
jgi:cytidylate kinase